LPNDSVAAPAITGPPGAAASDSPQVAQAAIDSARPPADTATKASVPTPGVSDPPRRPPALEPNARARLDQIKAALADQAPERAPGVLRNVDRLLPQLRTRDDSVEATYYAVEANLILDRTREACRLLNGARRKSEGTDFEVRIARILADPDLGCETR
jgi:hypothetical protein